VVTDWYYRKMWVLCVCIFVVSSHGVIVSVVYDFYFHRLVYQCFANSC
jgi:hypothetical protein